MRHLPPTTARQLPIIMKHYVKQLPPTTVRQLPTSIVCHYSQQNQRDNCRPASCTTANMSDEPSLQEADEPSLQEAGAPRPQPGGPPARGLPNHQTERHTSIIRGNCRLALCETTADNCETGTTDKHYVRQTPKSLVSKRPLPTQAATREPPAKACQSIIRQNYRQALCETTADKHHVRQLPTIARQTCRQTLCEATADKHYIRQLPIHYKTEPTTNIM